MTVDRRGVKLVESPSVANLSELVGPKNSTPDLDAHDRLGYAKVTSEVLFCPSVPPPSYSSADS